ncbi:hypothetical protein FHS23_002395 [Prauserella isguenensis]|uniref:Uncharacterized protein n=1 Tax=Prauserella isguenensis TaxID=1470180 RepID=A0A839S1V5_9PSEU|nr:hypothetical protein [Prauserella isguenensis]MBB3051372.1 hypothetical protein [Prauserella isguenensis]
MITLLFVAGLVLVLAGIGRAVRHPGLPVAVEPAFARHVVTGVAVLWRIGLAGSEVHDRVDGEATRRRVAPDDMA